jgi:hypothetical protein
MHPNSTVTECLIMNQKQEKCTDMVRDYVQNDAAVKQMSYMLHCSDGCPIFKGYAGQDCLKSQNSPWNA